MRKRQKNRRLKLTVALMCVFSASFILVYSIKMRSFDSTAKEASLSYSDTLYMSLQNPNSSSVISFDSVKDTNNAQDTHNTSVPQETSDNTLQNVPAQYENNSDYSEITTVNLLMHEKNKAVEIPLEDYVAAVVAAEMPASAPPEALKAQAVACRTLAVNLILTDDKSAHGGADICTNSAHCQSFASKAEYVEKYGDVGAKCFENAENAARATKGIILLYNSKPIVAAFHASSGEYTASSREVWGGNVDYLVSVKTKEIESDTLKSQVLESKSFTKSQFIERLEAAGVKSLSQYRSLDFHEWVSGITRTDSGRVDFIQIGSESVSGNIIKNALGLRSTNFSISYTDDVITFATKGYGHGVGMSQLGAAAMAQEGYTFYEILKYYYQGVSFGIAGD